MSKNNRTIEEIIEAIAELDLDCIKFKLMDKEEGQGWTQSEADHYEQEYKRFLTLLAKFPDETIVPTKNVDQFWHGHILDTKKYAEDCQQVFGYFLHHFPYLGMRGEEDAANFLQSVENTSHLYKAVFGSEARSLQESSFCGRVQESSFCGRVQIRGKDRLNADLRPTLS